MSIPDSCRAATVLQPDQATLLVLLPGASASAMAASIDVHNWRTNPELCRYGCSTNRNLIMFWQSILWVDDLDYVIGDGFIDGGFGRTPKPRRDVGSANSG